MQPLRRPFRGVTRIVLGGTMPATAAADRAEGLRVNGACSVTITDWTVPR